MKKFTGRLKPDFAGTLYTSSSDTKPWFLFLKQRSYFLYLLITIFAINNNNY